MGNVGQFASRSAQTSFVRVGLPGWDHLLMAQDDPEKRIADLEHQLAEQKRGAGLPLASPDDTAPSRRFVASGSTSPMQIARGCGVMFVAIIALPVVVYIVYWATRTPYAAFVVLPILLILLTLPPA